MTNLYNERPTWLAMRHADLDRAVWDAYGWGDADPDDMSDDDVLGRLLSINSQRAVGPHVADLPRGDAPQTGITD